MLKFIIVLLFFLIMAVISFFYLGGKNYEVIKKGGKMKQMSQRSQRRVTMVVKILCKIFAIALLFLLVIPMIRDVPNLLTNKYEIVQGVPLYKGSGPYGNGSLVQTLHMDGKDVVVYLHDYLPENAAYKVYYLKYSNYVIDVIKIK